MLDADGHYVYANKAFIEASGYGYEELLGKPYGLVLAPDMPRQVAEDMWHTLRSGYPWKGLLKNRHKNGSYYWVRAHAAPVLRAGRLVGCISVRSWPDAAEIASAEQVYERMLHKASSGLKLVKGVIVRPGLSGLASRLRQVPVRWQIRGINMAAASITAGVVIASAPASWPVVAIAAGLAALIGDLALEARIGKPLARLLAEAQAMTSGQSSRTRGSERTDEIGLLKRIVDHAWLNLPALYGDVVDKETEGPAARQMEHQLRIDKLTGVFNRDTYIEQLNQIKRKWQEQPEGVRPVHAILFIDLDNFKEINDTQGHDAGDRVLVCVAQYLKQAVRSGDIAARYGGDEFCVLLNDIGNPVHAENLAERIRAAIEQSIQLESGAIRVGASVGWAILGPDGDDADTLLKVADRRMSAAKAHGKAARAIRGGQGRQQLYGSPWTQVLAPFAAALQPRMRAIVDEFYEHITRLDISRPLMGALSEPEFEHLKHQQAQNMLMLASPDLTQELHYSAAKHIGQIHARVGLAREDLVQSHDILHAILRGHVNTAVYGEAFSLLARRLIRDLAWQMQAFQEVHERRQQLLLDMTEIAWKAQSISELILRAAEKLGDHDEIACCAFGGPGKNGAFRYESFGGDNARKFFDSAEALARLPQAAEQALSMGPTGRAWRSARISHCVNYATDSSVSVWRELVASMGFKSSAVIPLLEHKRAPFIVLVLFSAYPGGFAAPEHKAFLAQLGSILELAINRLSVGKERRPVVPFSARWHMCALLRSGGVDMFFQPVLDTRSGRILEVEALARMRDGDRIVMPDEFMPMFTDDDFLELYAQGLRQSLAQRKAWLETGMDIGVALNLPSSSLADGRYYEVTRQALDAHGCSPGALTLELLETGETAPDVDIAGALEQFKSLGVCLAEDDLGSGYSSLNRLHKLPFDIIKIDRSIVTPHNQNIVDVLRFIYQLTRLGHSLGKRVIVEGVEDAELLDAARMLGVDAVQGYVIARPMPARQITDWLAAHRADGVFMPHDAKNALTELAKLLIWEEQQHVLYGGQLSVDSALPETADWKISMPRFGSVENDIQQTLRLAAMHHGLHSSEYESARDRLVGALVSRWERRGPEAMK